MTDQKYDDKMHLDLPFGEALERFVGVDPAEMQANIAKAKKAKPPGGKKALPGDKVQAENLVSLREKRIQKRNRG